MATRHMMEQHIMFILLLYVCILSEVANGHIPSNQTKVVSRRKLLPQQQREAAPLRTEKPTPFMMLYTASVGSNWLMRELSEEPSICCIGVDPIDDICGDMVKGKNSGNGKRQLGWLRVALTPPSLETYSDFMGKRLGRGDAWKAAWRQWKLKLVQHSLPCRAEEIRNSFDGNQCDANDVRVYGFKTTLFAGGMLSDRNKQGKWDRFKEELHDGKVRIIRMKRNNRLEQALDVYWKQKSRVRDPKTSAKRVGGVGNVQKKVDDFERLDGILLNLNKREELLDSIIKYVNVPTLTMNYEELRENHRAAIRKLSAFLAVKISAMNDFASPLEDNQMFARDDSRALCEAVENYAEFCMYYSKSHHAEHLKDPCTPGVWDCCKCKPLPRMIFPNPINIKN